MTERYQGRPCKRGHSGIRYATTRQCVECLPIVMREWESKNRDRHLAAGRNWYRKNRTKILGEARAWRQRRPWVGREANWRRLGIKCTWDQYQEMFAAQNGVCAICSAIPTKRGLCLDHDHQDGRLRGLLCIRCNNLVGQIENGIAASATTYLEMRQ